ncbi:hypothetical protein BDR22DRAFT_824987 [Usnea florida]
MLRLNPTQLRLDARDLTWHIDRHNQRQSLRALGPPTNVSKWTKGPDKRQHDIPAQCSSFPLPLPSKARTTGPTNKHEDSIISDKPVPQDSRSFWDRVLANAGTPTRTQATSTGNATFIEPSDDFFEKNHSSRASIEDGDSDWHRDESNGSLCSDDLQSPLRETETDACFRWQNSSPPDSLDSNRIDANLDPNETDKEQKLSFDTVVTTASAKRRLSLNNFNFFRRKVTPSLDGSPEPQYFADRGAHDRYQSPRSHDRSRSDSSNSSAGGDLRDGLYGSRGDRRTISANLETCESGRSVAEGSESRQVSSRGGNGYVLPRLTPSRQSEDIPRHASGLPRSSLYISQAAMSSSPHKGRETTADTEIPASQDLLAIPPRRRKRYKPRSESYPFVPSEDLDVSIPPQLDGPSSFQNDLAAVPSLTVSYSSMQNMVSTPPPTLPARNHHPAGASPADTPEHGDYATGDSNHEPQRNYEWSSPSGSYPDSVEIHSYRSLSSMESHHVPNASSHGQAGNVHTSPSRRNFSPFAEIFVPRSARRDHSPQLSLPPPFSATPRNMSLNSAVPSSSVSPHTPPTRLSSYSISPVPRSHAQIPVYNDNLSPSTQPQTPAELPRNQRPSLATHNPFNTAPARPRGSTLQTERLASWQAFGTPTRMPSARPRRHRDFEQENVGAVDAEERRLRREMAMELRMGREELERFEGR